MPDFARSTDPAVQAQIDRLTLLSPGADILGLDRITRLLERVGNPHLRLPPVLHVAGTNGKGSTCAFLRAALEAAGLRVHVYSSPHLVRFNERIRLAGTLIDDATLAPLLADVLDAGGDIGASFFEVTTAAAFLAFARTPADACVIEVGLGGRLDATNVIPAPIATGIAQLGIDHQAFLGDTLPQIAREKAGIAKPGVPLVTMRYDPKIAVVVAAAGVPVLAQGGAWDYAVKGDRLTYRDAKGTLETPLPTLSGPHQPGNLALAIAMLRHQDTLVVSDTAFAAAATGARWPARMQRLGHGPLTALLPAGTAVWLDGGHNAAAGEAIAETVANVAAGARSHLILGMLANKDPEGLIAPLVAHLASVTAVPIPGHAHHAPEDLVALLGKMGVQRAQTATDVPSALHALASHLDSAHPGTILILGSLYLAGTVLQANAELPD
ncbi:bifunctional folylpolyglutamate synthase/dihydrofolate synthase [Sphingomonas sp. HT-1]|uniref:bifunctional folylpolyglutamate synthase/dihydrofolate synthase n=1 Tax=unclassified Sphingomonas TaxID=196159 RepID=UPI0002FAFE5B|nr:MULTISPECIES: folylpolyglutamate synthase/dihydrofolate synthase family protein [unclassified Sphingomonas]KTF69237.1 bifunctional folylpolyglutamate synthase/dihydrofolate synthase [Sphingomonas sp. WG]